MIKVGSKAPDFALKDQNGKTVKLWAQDHEGWLTMDAVATLR
mgnify:CR=1 FL=1